MLSRNGLTAAILGRCRLDVEVAIMKDWGWLRPSPKYTTFPSLSHVGRAGGDEDVVVHRLAQATPCVSSGGCFWVNPR